MSDAKAMFRDAANIGAFIKQYGYGIGHTFFMTITFKSNQDKLACASSFNVFRTFLNKPSVRYSHGLDDANFHYIAVWEQHKKGGWHMHILGHIEGASTKKLRALTRHFLGVTSTSVGFINIKWTYGHDMHGVRLYMTKYLSKDKNRRIHKVRYINYSRNWMRACCLPFSWVGGLAAQWRKACQELFLNLPHSFKTFYHNCSYRLRLSVMTFWLSGQYDAAIDLIAKNFRMGGMTDCMREDLRRLKCFFDEVGGVIFDSTDSAVADFLSFSCPPLVERKTAISIDDSECIPLRG